MFKKLFSIFAIAGLALQAIAPSLTYADVLEPSVKVTASAFRTDANPNYLYVEFAHSNIVDAESVTVAIFDVNNNEIVSNVSSTSGIGGAINLINGNTSPISTVFAVPLADARNSSSWAYAATNWTEFATPAYVRVTIAFSGGVVTSTPSSFDLSNGSFANSIAQYAVHNETQNTYHPTISAAITASQSGDVINVSSGTYNEPVGINKSLTIKGSANVIINGKITINGGSDVTLSNFTLNHNDVAAIKVPSTVSLNSLTIDSLKVTSPKAIYIADGSSSTITTLSITNSSISSNYPIYVDHTIGNLVLTNNTFTTTDNGNRGVVFSKQSNPTTTISNNTFIIDNLASQIMKFEPAESADMNAILTNNTFPDGSAVDASGTKIIFTTACVTDQASLNSAIALTSISTIKICNDFSLTTKVSVNRPLTIDGNNKIISGNELTIVANNVNVKDLTLSGSVNYGLQAYIVTGVTLDNITMINSSKGGILINGSEVSANNITLIDNMWGGIDVSQGGGVTAVPKLTIIGPLSYTGATDNVLWNDDYPTISGVVVGFESVGLVKYTSGTVENYTYPTACVTDQASLIAAIAKSYISTIKICNDFALTTKVSLDRSVTIEGSGHTISGNEITITANNVNVSNLTISGSANYGIQAYVASGINLTNMTVTNSAKGAILVNGSQVGVTNLTLANNNWGGIEVSKGSGVTATPKLTIVGVINHSNQSEPAIWIDKQVTNSGWVINYLPSNLEEVIKSDKNQLWFTKKPIPVVNIPSVGGGGGGSSFSSVPINSNPIVTTTSVVTTSSNPRNITPEREIVLGGEVDQLLTANNCSIEGSNYNQEENNAYLYACNKDITTMKTIQLARMNNYITRAELAKMLSQYAVNELGLTPDTNKDCGAFTASNAGQDQEMKKYMIMSCQLNIMGIQPDKSALIDFRANDYVTRAEFGTVMSRIMRGDKYESANLNLWYADHLQALKTSNIIKDTTPTTLELRARVMLILQRSSSN